ACWSRGWKGCSVAATVFVRSFVAAGLRVAPLPVPPFSVSAFFATIDPPPARLRYAPSSEDSSRSSRDPGGGLHEQTVVSDVDKVDESAGQWVTCRGFRAQDARTPFGEDVMIVGRAGLFRGAIVALAAGVSACAGAGDGST